MVRRAVVLAAAFAAPATFLAAIPAAVADGVMLVRAGAFWMGGNGGPPEEAPEHRVFVTDFWIERHKVTNAEFTEFLNAGGWVSAEGERRYDVEDADARIHLIAVGAPPPGLRPPTVGPAPPVAEGRWLVKPGYERHPAVEVSWFGARDFCAWRGRRLPTEAEWEKAARGDDRRPYPWGAPPPTPERAVFGRRYNATEPVDARPQGTSPYGVEDMLGNLREWTSSVFRPYPYRADDGRAQWDGKTGAVVVRGASHDDPPDSLSVTRRRYYERRGAAAGHHHVGFRCATSEDLGEVAR
jgi:iron(II)-dependent oxidoreductase